MTRRVDFNNRRKQEYNQRNITLFDDHWKVRKLYTASYAIKSEFVLAGITKAQFICLKIVLDLDYFTLSSLLAITERTIHMKKEADTFSHIISDRIMNLAELYSYGYHVFASRVTFNTWMKTPNDYFDGFSPIQLMVTQVGYKVIENEIYRLSSGTF